MNRLMSGLVWRRAALMALAAVVAGCDSSNDPVALGEAPTVVLGRVATVTSAAGSSPSTLAGIEISAEGSPAFDVTDGSGSFRLEVESNGDRIRLRFRRGSLDLRLELSGVPSGGSLHLEVGLGDGGVTVLSAREGDENEFEGVASLVSVSGDEPDRTVRVELSMSSHRWVVDVVEGSTLFDREGDVLSLGDLLLVLDRADLSVEIEGEGELQADGSIVATEVKVETDD